jgi:hypothetical protein
MTKLIVALRNCANAPKNKLAEDKEFSKKITCLGAPFSTVNPHGLP